MTGKPGAVIRLDLSNCRCKLWLAEFVPLLRFGTKSCLMVIVAYVVCRLM